jgi:hypothetical protein
MTEHRTCPKCGSTRVGPIAYGEATAELEARARRGAVVLGGCLVGLGPDGDPVWACRACGERFGRIDWEAAEPREDGNNHPGHTDVGSKEEHG